MNSGAGLWIGSLNSVLGFSPSSIGSQRTLNILQSTFSHTGVLIGASVATTSIPLFNQSTVFMAIVLTTLSQSCCCVSRTTLLSAHFTSNAS